MKKIEIYLVMGECDGFGNDVFLRDVEFTEELAIKKLEETYFYGRQFKDLSNEAREELSEIIEIHENSDMVCEVSEIVRGGIYKIEREI